MKALARAGASGCRPAIVDMTMTVRAVDGGRVSHDEASVKSATAETESTAVGCSNGTRQMSARPSRRCSPDASCR